MNKLTKGTASAMAAAVLLLGGAGSLAYWTDGQTSPGTSVNNGRLKLVTQTAGDWKLNAETTTYAPATQKLVPGDKLTKTVTFRVDAKGDYIKARFAAVNPSWNATSAVALTNEITLAASYQVSTDNGATWGTASNGVTPVNVADGNLVRAVITVDWAFGTVNNTSNVTTGLVATLNDIAVTVTQVQ